jgi:transcriptional regulator with XRE-family HTH domain
VSEDFGFDFDKLVGSNVQKYRTARGMSQAELAEAISAEGEHVHQQTIQKIEKGTRPLKLSEAQKIARALRLSPWHLTDDMHVAKANANFVEGHTELSAMTTELHEFARRLAPLLVDLATAIALQRSDDRYQVSPYLIEFSQSWLENNWGKILNNALLEELRRHKDLSTILAEYDAPTYGEVLTRFAARELPAFRPGIDDDNLESFDDASET